MQKKWGKFVRQYLIFAGIYLLADALIHLFDIKLIGSSGHWPANAIEYAKFMGHLYASVAIGLAAISLFAQRDIQKYKTLIQVAAVWSFFHGLLLIYTSLMIDFPKMFPGQPAIYIWLPFYNGLLFFEAVLSIGFSTIVYLWWRSEKR